MKQLKIQFEPLVEDYCERSDAEREVILQNTRRIQHGYMLENPLGLPPNYDIIVANNPPHNPDDLIYEGDL